MAKPENVESKKTKKEKKAKEPKSAEFPLKGFINPQGFIYLSKEILEAFGVEKGKKINIIIDMNDGALIIAKENDLSG